MPAARPLRRSAKLVLGSASDPNEEVVIPPYMRGTLALLAALPADRPLSTAELARLVGGRTQAWQRLVDQLVTLRLADDVGLDGRPLLLATPAGLVLRARLCRPGHVPAHTAQNLIERLGLERLALLEAVAELGPLSLADLLAACEHLAGNNREPPLARSRFLAMTRRHRLLEPVPEDELVELPRRRYRATDAAWHIVAARRRLHAEAYDLTAFAARVTALRATGTGEPASSRPRRRRPQPGPPAQLRLL